MNSGAYNKLKNNDDETYVECITTFLQVLRPLVKTCVTGTIKKTDAKKLIDDLFSETKEDIYELCNIH